MELTIRSEQPAHPALRLHDTTATPRNFRNLASTPGGSWCCGERERVRRSPNGYALETAR